MALQKKSKASIFNKGLWAEQLVKLWFWMKGYRLLFHRWRHKSGEIDLVFFKKNELVFVEVKFRTNGDHLEYALSFQQQQRLMKGMLFFQQKYPAYQHIQPRFDVMWVNPGRWPIHLKNVW